MASPFAASVAALHELHTLGQVRRLGFNQVAERRDVDAHGGGSGDAGGSESEAPRASPTVKKAAAHEAPSSRAAAKAAMSVHQNRRAMLRPGWGGLAS